jgi:regulator of sirC expression with transglutaminase-like and TPR domain
MGKDRQVRALLQLIDDPDVEVYETVADRILDYGKSIIPDLELLWEHTQDQGVQQRIETLIHRVHFMDLEHDFYDWSMERKPALLRGALLLCRLHYPELQIKPLLTQIDAMRRNIWLELNNYLTPLEKVNVFNSILFNYYKLQGHELSARNPEHFFLNKALESRQGNGYTFGILYLTLCEMLDIPVFAVDVPRQLVFAYIDSVNPFLDPEHDSIPRLSFFVDPMNGGVYTRREVEAYLHKLGVSMEPSFLVPMDPRRVMFKMMEELARCYHYARDEDKAREVEQLMKIIVPDFKRNEESE